MTTVDGSSLKLPQFEHFPVYIEEADKGEEESVIRKRMGEFKNNDDHHPSEALFDFESAFYI